MSGGDRLGGLPRSFQKSAIAIPDIAEPRGSLALARDLLIDTARAWSDLTTAEREASTGRAHDLRKDPLLI